MVIEYDGGVIDDDFFFGAISNTNEVAGLFKFDNCDVKLNDGLFEVILVRKLKKCARCVLSSQKDKGSGL